MIEKKILRKAALKKRKELVTQKLTATIVSKILKSKDFIEAKNIALYYPINSEIDITPITRIKNKNFYLPVCKNKNLEFSLFKNEHSLIEGKFNIKEPKGFSINPNILDIIYIPALMANRACYRLGYGKGYYDRFFSNNDIKAKKIMVLPSKLICDDFKEDDFDIPCDVILSEI